MTNSLSDNNESKEEKNLSDKQYDVLLSYFNTLRDEIHLRIKEHSKLVWIKVVVIGAIISFFITSFSDLNENLEFLSYLIWIIPLSAIIFDVLITHNLKDVNRIGKYIRDYFENKIFKDIKNTFKDFLFWEEKVAQPENKGWTCYNIYDMLCIWLLTLASVFFSFMFSWYASLNILDLILFSISLILIIVILIFMMKTVK